MKMMTHYEVAEEETETIHMAYLAGESPDEIKKERHVSFKIYIKIF